MATSPNYGWSEPDNTSLVKDGALAIRTLGDAIDTSVWNVGYGQAGKNKIINGDFAINQRAFTSTTTTVVYTVDRWQTDNAGGTSTYSVETFTPGAAPVAGYEGKNFARIVSTGQSASTDNTRFIQYIESVRSFAGQTVTVSFWAKAGSGTPSVACYFEQRFGVGGSPSSTVILDGQKASITNSWARYSFTFSIPSISGKTIGTTNDGALRFLIVTSAGSTFNARTDSLGIQSATIDLWGVQIEAGSKATPFQTASGGSIQGELSMCQRYYFRNTPGAVKTFGIGQAIATTQVFGSMVFPVEMRVRPTALEQSGTASDYSATNITATRISASAVLSYDGTTTTRIGMFILTATAGFVAGSGSIVFAETANGYLGWSAEL